MGLDQYAYTKDKRGDDKEISYWRKHNRLQGWMENLWLTKKAEAEKKRDIGDRFIDALSVPEREVFNGIELELDEVDIDSLENSIKNKDLPQTGGFFFGDDSYEGYEDDNGYKKVDLDFIKKARKELKKGNKVYYNSSW